MAEAWQDEGVTPGPEMRAPHNTPQFDPFQQSPGGT